jgi:lipopolysaccharide/colanic/teichoic acid biosynthesis glycosyltransferase
MTVYDCIKRGLDMVVSAAGLIVVGPMLLGLWFLVLYLLGSPALFRQQRTGRNNTRFTVLKFRTMADMRTNNGELLDDDARIQPFGRVLRATGIDELPQLWNILRGDMSLVGPRPLLPQYEPLYTLEQARRHKVRPGLTGWAQVNGRADLPWARQFELDVWYVDNRSLQLDVLILCMSFLVSLRQLRQNRRSVRMSRPEFTGMVSSGDSVVERTTSLDRDDRAPNTEF